MAKYNQTISQSDFEQIEAYLLNSIDPASRHIFEQRIIAEPWLKDEVQLQKKLMGTIEADAFVTEQRTAFVPKTRRLGLHLLIAAASIIIIAATGLWFFDNGQFAVQNKLYTEYYQPDPGLPVEMSASDSTTYAFYDGMISYQEGDFSEALRKWRMLVSIKTNDTLQYYIAHGNLNMGHIKESIQGFERVRTDSSSAYHKQASWYMALIFLKQGEDKKAKALLKAILNYPGAKSLYDKL